MLSIGAAMTAFRFPSSLGLVGFIFTGLFFLPLQSQAQKSPQEKESEVSSPWASPRPNSPDTELLLKEERKVEDDGKARVSYTLEPRGLPSGKRYVVWVKQRNSEPRNSFRQGGFILNPSGKLVCEKSPPKKIVNMSSCVVALEDMQFYLDKFHLGEAAEFAITSDDGTINVYAKAIPWPLSGAEILRNTGQIDALGRPPLIVLLPAVVGQRGGRARVTLETSQCRPTLSYPWGSENTPRP